jgi:branched-chain amino acid aminotransferase
MNFSYTNKMADYIWINGEFVAWNDAFIHVITHSLHYSGAVYEGERSYNGIVFKLDEHSERLLKSAQYMGLKVEYTKEQINNITNEVLVKNNLKDAYIRPLIWRGAESIGVYNDNLTVNMLIAAIPSKPEFKNQMRLLLSPWRKSSINSLPPQAKSSAHYGMAITNQIAAKQGGYDDSLILDQEGYVAECNVANIFFGIGNKLVTPIADRFLNGITRQAVIVMAENIGFTVNQERVSLEDLGNYDYCFMSGTAKEIAGIALINLETSEVTFPDPLAKITVLQEAFAKMVGKESAFI